jgi:ABC-type glycerol-3-phosphate transport system substrate-binding protein
MVLAMGGVGRLVMLGACMTALVGCGGSSSGTGSPSVSATQYANSQRDAGYLRAVNQSTAAFNKAPKNPTDYQAGLRKLQVALRKLHSLSVPDVFATAQAHLIAALAAISQLAPRFERAARAHNEIALNNLEARNVGDQSAMNAAFREMATVYNKCRHSKFAEC